MSEIALGMWSEKRSRSGEVSRKNELPNFIKRSDGKEREGRLGGGERVKET
jgi:hypothetical protein